MAKPVSIKTNIYAKVNDDGNCTIMAEKFGNYRPIVHLSREDANAFLKTIGSLNHFINAPELNKV